MKGMFKNFCLGAGALALFPTADAVAQIEDEDEYTVPASEREGRRIFHRYSKCLFDRNKSGARALLSFQATGGGLHEAALDLHEKKCFDSRGYAMKMTFAPLAMQHGVADVLVDEDLSDFAPSSFELVPLINHGPAPQVDKALLPTDPEERRKKLLAHERAFHAWLVRNLAECAVRLSPSASRTLLNTKIAGEDEVDALAEVNRVIARCRPEGMDRTIENSDLRGAVAFSYYRLAIALRNKNHAKTGAD